MPKTEYTVLDPVTGLYLTQYNVTTPTNSLFGNAADCIGVETMEEAERLATNINSGTVGTIKP